MTLNGEFDLTIFLIFIYRWKPQIKKWRRICKARKSCWCQTLAWARDSNLRVFLVSWAMRQQPVKWWISWNHGLFWSYHPNKHHWMMNIYSHKMAISQQNISGITILAGKISIKCFPVFSFKFYFWCFVLPVKWTPDTTTSCGTCDIRWTSVEVKDQKRQWSRVSKCIKSATGPQSKQGTRIHRHSGELISFYVVSKLKNIYIFWLFGTLVIQILWVWLV